MWNDHKNLEYIWTAKQLNPHQAQWALLFDKFNFDLSYRPGSKNPKPDTLSSLYQREEGEDSTVITGHLMSPVKASVPDSTSTVFSGP